MLSPADWALIESWKSKGIPLYIVLRGIESAFDRYNSKPRRRSVKSLFYCQEEVEAQFAEWMESRLGARPAADGEEQSGSVANDATTTASLPFPREVIAEHLARAHDGLQAARTRRAADDLYHALDRAGNRLEELRLDFEVTPRPDIQAIEDCLTHLEELIDRALQTSLGAEEIAQSRAAAEAQLKPYKDRMASEAYGQTLNNLMAKSLRERAGVPRLSLFYI